MDCFTDVIIICLCLDRSNTLAVYPGSENQKYLNLCFVDERRSGFGTTSGRGINDNFNFWVNYPFNKLNNVNKWQLTVKQVKCSRPTIFTICIIFSSVVHVNVSGLTAMSRNLALIIKILLKDLSQVITLVLGINCSLLSYNDSRSFNWFILCYHVVLFNLKNWKWVTKDY